MREISVTGNLAADAEVLQTKNGENYLRFRMGNHEFGDDKEDTRWFDVTMFNIPKIAQFLKKGTGVRVIGDYKDSTYESEKYGTVINRNITAFKVDFWSSGKNNSDAPKAEAEKTEAPAAPVAAKPAKAQSKKTTATKDSLPFGDSPEPMPADDDLPF